MERDPGISKLIKESGIIHTPEQFTSQVMNKIGIVSEKNVYKPIIGRSGRIVIVFFILSIVLISVLFSEPGGRFLENSGIIPDVEWKMPEINFNLSFLQDINLPGGLLSAVLALFILVISDASIRKRRLYQKSD